MLILSVSCGWHLGGRSHGITDDVAGSGGIDGHRSVSGDHIIEDAVNREEDSGEGPLEDTHRRILMGFGGAVDGDTIIVRGGPCDIIGSLEVSEKTNVTEEDDDTNVVNIIAALMFLVIVILVFHFILTGNLFPGKMRSRRDYRPENEDMALEKGGEEGKETLPDPALKHEGLEHEAGTTEGESMVLVTDVVHSDGDEEDHTDDESGQLKMEMGDNSAEN